MHAKSHACTLRSESAWRQTIINNKSNAPAKADDLRCLSGAKVVQLYSLAGNKARIGRLLDHTSMSLSPDEYAVEYRHKLCVEAVYDNASTRTCRRVGWKQSRCFRRGCIILHSMDQLLRSSIQMNNRACSLCMHKVGACDDYRLAYLRLALQICAQMRYTSTLLPPSLSSIHTHTHSPPPPPPTPTISSSRSFAHIGA